MNDRPNILGLHFGHDCAACVFRDVAGAGYALREMHNRTQHAWVVVDAEYERALIDACASEG